MIPAVRAYLRRGWCPVPLRAKRPFAPGWPSRTFAEADFADADGVGLHLLGGLCDVDCDCPEAIALAPRILPPTPLVFGRESSPASHWLYLSDGRMSRYQVDGDCLVELRAGRGKQTMAPPSRHPSGEVVRWEPGSSLGAGPVRVPGDELGRAVTRIAAGCLLLRDGWDIPRVLATVAGGPVPGVPELARRWLGWEAPPAPRPARRVEDGADDLREATRRYCAEHAREYSSRRTTCPVCGGSGFTAARREGCWSCFSARHQGVGVAGHDCWTGDALDLDAHAAGRTAVEWLRECGYLREPRRFAPDVYDDWARK